MANTKSAAKRARVNLRRNVINTRTRSSVKTWEKKLRKAITAKDSKSAKEVLQGYMAQVMKAAKKGVYHQGYASRKIAQLSKHVSKLN